MASTAAIRPEVIVNYRDWIPYNILRVASKYATISSLLIGLVTAILVYALPTQRLLSIEDAEMRQKQTVIASGIAGAIAAVISYIILRYYETSFFK